MYRKITRLVQTVPILLYLRFLGYQSLGTCVICMVRLLHLTSLDSCITIKISWYFISISLVFSFMFSSVPGSYPVYHISLRCKVSVALLGCDGFSLPSSFTPFSFDGSWSVTWYTVLQLGFVCCLLMIRPKLRVWGRKTREVKCHFHHIVSRIYAIHVTYRHPCWLEHLLGVHILQSKVTPPSPLPFHTVLSCAVHV